MLQFNSDGSIKLPEKMANSRSRKQDKMRNERALILRKEIICKTSPKKCKLTLFLSDKIEDSRFVETIFNQVKINFETPVKLFKENRREFYIEIGTAFKRCTECSKLINEYRQFINGNFFEENWGCTFKPREMCYEDHFE